MSMAKAKLTAGDTADPSDILTSSEAGPDAHADKPAKRGRKPKAGSGKRVTAPKDNGDDVDELEQDEPAPKRCKKGVEGEAEHDYV